MDIKKVVEVITKIKKEKYQAYLVGGSSRDLLMCNDFEDIDIATSCPIKEISKLFTIVDDKGKGLGSVKINYKGIVMELTSFRKEMYDFKGIFPKIEAVKTPDEDYLRRDFTINAIYLDVSNNELIDPSEGLKDMFASTIRFIGDPNIRVKEDPTRIIRGLRFAYQFNFKIEASTNQAFIDNIKELDRVNDNHFNKEVSKMEEALGMDKTNQILNMYHIERRSNNECK